MSLTVVMGPMFAGKSSWIVQQVRRHAATGLHGIVIKPLIESRQGNEHSENIVTHDSTALDCISWPIQNKLETLIQMHAELIANANFVIVDEAQFMTGLYDFTKCLLQMSKKVVLVGLNGDYLQRPFQDLISNRPEFLECISLSNHVELLHSLCDECGNGSIGSFTKRMPSNDSNQVVQIGTKDSYKAVCRKHL